ncbi:MAG: T9SS type A sorting domain-containing protein [Saprospiraceae bacterium]|nr:T9SS type A sorting domain-containing protein [Saprospiraceae bacterium]MDW8483217.1 T9SS type A sorting domain-containing protein [Saprospiraceae bacterium]
MQRTLLVCSLLVLSVATSSAQGWERVFDGGGQGQINDIQPAADGGYVAVGYYANLSRARLFKINADGYLQFTRDFSLGTQATAEGLALSPDGSYALAGFTRTGLNPRRPFVIKTDAKGNALWTFFLSSPFDTEAKDIVALSDGSFVVCGHRKNSAGVEDVLVFRLSATGQLLWSNTYGETSTVEKANALALMPDGSVVVVGEKKVVPRDIWVARIAPSNGSLLWENTFNFFEITTGTPADDVARAVTVDTDGHILIGGRSTYEENGVGLLMKVSAQGTGQALWRSGFPRSDIYGLAKAFTGEIYATGTKATNQSEDVYIVRTNAQGVKICDVTIGRPGFDQGMSIVVTPDGGAIAAGVGEFFFPTIGSESNPYLVRMDRNCVSFSSYVAGKIFYDINGNCTRDANEPGLENWIVRLESPNFTRYAVAKSGGEFLLLVDTGHYKVKLFPPNNSWASCVAEIPLKVSGFLDTFTVEVPVRALSLCPRNEVDVATPILRRCTNNVYTVRYCNSGTLPSANTRIEIELDRNLTLVSSSIPATPLSGNKYAFDIGLLPNGECGSFTFVAFLDCNTLTGQTHCVRAHIYPDSFCNVSGWDRSIVQARAACEQGVVRLSLANVGTGDMQSSVGFVIAEDVIMLTQPGDPLYRRQLKAGEESIVWTTPANGRTYRVIAEQTAGYPGTSYPTAAVEGCRSDTSAPFSIGFYTMFAEDDLDPFRSYDCQESAPPDFNPIYLKRGHPKGYGVEHYVRPETEMEYLIQFRNATADTVFQVVVRDTLPPFLDPATVRPGTASHPYEFDVYGSGIVQFTLPTAVLSPQGSGSEGFVKFRVAFTRDIPCRTKVRNTAAVYFDFNAPALTNQTFHTVCDLDTFIVVKTKNIHWKGADVKVYPNPFESSTIFEIKGAEAESYLLEILDLQGRVIFSQRYDQPIFRLQRQQLPAGMLFFRITSDRGEPIASGKLLVR